MAQKRNIVLLYQNLLNTWRAEGLELEVHTFNSAVYPSGFDLSSMKFWGPTAMESVIEYITTHSITDANILIVTDDNGFETNASSLTSSGASNLSKIAKNRVSLLQIGESVRTLKDEITKAILASNGSFTVINEESDGKGVLETNAFMETIAGGKCLNASEYRTELDTLLWYQYGRMLLAVVSGSGVNRDVGDAVTNAAKTYHFVSPYSSMIALENDTQRQSLDRYSAQDNRYDTTYENHTNDAGSQVSPPMRGDDTPNNRLLNRSNASINMMGGKVREFSPSRGVEFGAPENLFSRMPESNSGIPFGIVPIGFIILILSGIVTFFQRKKLAIKKQEQLGDDNMMEEKGRKTEKK